MANKVRILFKISVILYLLIITICYGICIIDSKHINIVATENMDISLYNIIKTSDINKRDRTIVNMAKSGECEECVMWFLMSDDPFMYGNYDKTMASQITRKSIADILDSVPKDSSKALLLAITTKLSDVEYGRYSEFTGGIIGRRSEKITLPIRDHAKKALVRIVEKDFGYDAGKWRSYIVEWNREINSVGPVETGPTGHGAATAPSATTQPTTRPAESQILSGGTSDPPKMQP